MNLTQQSCCDSGTCSPSTSSSAKTLRPAISSRNEEHGVHLDVALPGVPKDDLKLTIREGLLSLEAKRSGADEGGYSLSVKLAERLDGSRIRATLVDGILSAFIPLRDEARPKEVPIS